MAKLRKARLSVTRRSVVYVTTAGAALLLLLFFAWNAEIRSSSMSDMMDYEHMDPRALSAAVSAALSSPSPTYVVASDTPQYVLLSFDGSKSIDMLNETLTFQKNMVSKGKPLHFTYFINAAYFLSEDKAALYQAPHEKRGVSNIGFSNSIPDISRRVHMFNEAVKGGNEIGSHTAGHFVGTDWTYEDWKHEFNSFFTILFGAQQNALPIAVEPWIITHQQIRGFRAPSLGINENLYQVLGDFSFRYDSSGIGPEEAWPKKDQFGIWHIPIGIMEVGLKKKPVLAMDYNLLQDQSEGKDRVKRGTKEWQKLLDDTVAAYKEYFDENYSSSRAPIVIVNHFSKWNDGVYWEAMKMFAEEECGKPNVRCTTFSEFVNYLDTVGPPKSYLPAH